MDKEKQILEAITKGIPLREISRRTGVHFTTLSWRVKNQDKYKIARQKYLTMVDNIFCG